MAYQYENIIIANERRHRNAIIGAIVSDQSIEIYNHG